MELSSPVVQAEAATLTGIGTDTVVPFGHAVAALPLAALPVQPTKLSPKEPELMPIAISPEDEPEPQS